MIIILLVLIIAIIIVAQSKKKLKQIYEKDINNLNNNIESLNANLKEKDEKIASLSKYQQIIDIESKCNEIITNAHNESEKVKENSLIEKNSIDAKIKERKKEYEDILTTAVNQSKKIIEDANIKAKEIAGDAYTALNEYNDLQKKLKAIKNIIDGYGNEYLVPTHGLLDDLADDFGYTEAGAELKKAREQSKLMVKNGLSAKCDYVENNRKNTAINFVTDAFNGKVDTILTTIKTTNYGILNQKIIDSYHLVNDLGKAFRNAVITDEYLQSRLNELTWGVQAFELKEKQKEEQRLIKEQMREEEKSRREYEKAIKEAEKEEETLKKLMEKAKIQLEAANEQKRAEYEAKLIDLQNKLKQAEEKNQRALSMAQQTKSGHVYIISNIGSFGEDVYKIGMTRRLEPLDRVKELSDASVPFNFDVHSMIFSNDAPKLETELHKLFSENQVNKVNPKKEFFKVNIKAIREKIESMGIETKWTMLADAVEYRESLAIQNKTTNSKELVG